MPAAGPSAFFNPYRFPALADDAVAAPNPVIIVEVLSPGTTSTDTGGKLADYFCVPSVAHYLICILFAEL
jgi:Uma2 family endonuclease